MNKLEALQAACKAFGSQVGMANALGVSQPTIWRWMNNARQLPAEHVLKVEAATGVSRHHLRPDIYPPVSPRFLGVDRAANRVSFNRLDEMQAPAA